MGGCLFCNNRRGSFSSVLTHHVASAAPHAASPFGQTLSGLATRPYHFALQSAPTGVASVPPHGTSPFGHPFGLANPPTSLRRLCRACCFRRASRGFALRATPIGGWPIRLTAKQNHVSCGFPMSDVAPLRSDNRSRISSSVGKRNLYLLANNCVLPFNEL